VALPPAPTSSTAGQVQLDLLRRAGTARRFALARSLSSTVIELSRQAIRARQPGLDDTGVLLRWAELHYGPELARKIRAHLDARR